MIRPPMLTLDFDELIVDSFAGGGGASQGIQEALGRGPDIAINHDAEAIALHAANHPRTTHYQESVWKIDPREVCGDRPVGLMWLSPDCKHFSKAKGGKPVSKKIRGLAWIAIRWAAAVKPRVIVLENVEEFQTWGPVLDDGKPCPVRKGSTFRAFKRKLERLGYRVEHRELRACDYGAPTIRKRLFLIARCDGQPIRWPAPTHGKGHADAWRTAAECIDWSLPCPSIFERKKPLAENTLKRIGRGIRRFVVETDTPFIVGVGGRAGQSPERSVESPLGTITAKGDMAVVTPFVSTYYGPRAGAEQDGRGSSIDSPVATQTAENRHALVSPILVPTAHSGGEERAHAVDAPVRTIAGHRGDEALIASMLVPRYGERRGQEPRTRDIQQPLSTIVPTQNGDSLVGAFLTQNYENWKWKHEGISPGSPAGTITSKDHHSLINAHLLKLHGSSKVGRQLDLPFPTVRAGGTHLAEVRAFLVAYYGNEKDGGTLVDPMRTLSTRDRFGLVTVKGVEYVIADIGMRMLAPRELYRAQGFPESYKIDIPFNGKPMTKTAQVRMVGNSVCPPLARAIVLAQFMGDAQEAAA